jgi:hypothetical protein
MRLNTQTLSTQIRRSSRANRKVNPTCIPSRWISLKISSFLTQRNPKSQANALNTSRESIKSVLHSFVYVRVLSLLIGLILESAFSGILLY